MTTQQRSFTTTLWDFFCSLKLSIFLLIALAITSIIGTVIPQVPVPPEYLNTISAFRFKLYSLLGFFDMYNSWWFLALLFLLSLNLIACSLKRLPRVWKMIKEPTLVMDEGLEKSLTLTHSLKTPLDALTAREKFSALLAKEFATPVATTTENEQHLFAQKQSYARLGVYVVHLSIIVIFLGAIIGSFWGYKGYANIVEGTAVTEIDLHRAPGLLKLRNSISRFFGKEVADSNRLMLPFQLKCEDFNVSFYDTGAPKEFKSVLTVIENGQEVVKNRSIVVNDPLTYQGITFYQSSYGPAMEGSVYYITVRDKKGGAPQKLALRQGQRATIAGGGTVEVLEATADVSRFMPGFAGPAARLELVQPGAQPESVLVFMNYPQIDEQRGGRQIITFDGADEKMYTGLQVARDPGVWVVWLGCALMVIGIYMAFFMSHRRIWVRVSKGHITIGGTASKNPAGFQLFFDQLVEKTKQL